MTPRISPCAALHPATTAVARPRSPRRRITRRRGSASASSPTSAQVPSGLSSSTTMISNGAPTRSSTLVSRGIRRGRFTVSLKVGRTSETGEGPAWRASTAAERGRVLARSPASPSAGSNRYASPRALRAARESPITGPRRRPPRVPGCILLPRMGTHHPPPPRGPDIFQRRNWLNCHILRDNNEPIKVQKSSRRASGTRAGVPQVPRASAPGHPDAAGAHAAPAGRGRQGSRARRREGHGCHAPGKDTAAGASSCDVVEVTPGVGIILVSASRCLRQIPWLRLRSRWRRPDSSSPFRAGHPWSRSRSRSTTSAKWCPPTDSRERAILEGLHGLIRRLRRGRSVLQGGDTLRRHQRAAEEERNPKRGVTVRRLRGAVADGRLDLETPRTSSATSRSSDWRR